MTKKMGIYLALVVVFLIKFFSDNDLMAMNGAATLGAITCCFLGAMIAFCVGALIYKFFRYLMKGRATSHGQVSDVRALDVGVRCEAARLDPEGFYADLEEGFTFEDDDEAVREWFQDDYTYKHTDGTRVRVYESRDDVAGKYTAVLRSSDWDASAVPGMLAMIGMSRSPTHPQGFSQFSSGLEGPHLGRRLQWSEVPEHIRAHIVARISGE